MLKEVCTEECSWRLIIFLDTCYTNTFLNSEFVYTEREFSKTNALDHSFLLLSFSCGGELNQISLN